MIAPDRIGRKVKFRIELVPQTFVHLAGRQIESAELSGFAVPTVIDVQRPVVEAYGPPANRPTLIERFELGETSLVHDGDRVGIHIDLSTLELPPLCHFRFVRTVAAQEFEAAIFSLVGLEKLNVTPGKVDLHLIGRRAAASDGA
jgi:hypothetical protein